MFDKYRYIHWNIRNEIEKKKKRNILVVKVRKHKFVYEEVKIIPIKTQNKEEKIILG